MSVKQGFRFSAKPPEPTEPPRKVPMCEWGTDEPCYLHIDADLSCDGEEKWKMVGIDKCIAPIVKALQLGGINMRGSCCGHGKGPGQIDLSDGRMIRIYPTTSWKEGAK